MKLIIDPNSPIPLYHQIAESLSYHINTGRIRPGGRLPSVRDAASAWNVNMHTVRRAYNELSERGLVEIRGSQGTCVLGIEVGALLQDGSGDLDEFLHRLIVEGHTEHGLTRHDIIRLLANYSPRRSDAPSIINMVECSETQCFDHVKEIEARWDVDARPWYLSQVGEPPAGPIVATYFHYNEIRSRWPHRIHETRFTAIHPDPRLLSDIRKLRTSGKVATLTLCEFDESLACNIVADLLVLIPKDRYRIKTRILTRGIQSEELSGKRNPMILPPRVWDSIEAGVRQDLNAAKVTYVFADEELETMGAHFGWNRSQQRSQLG